METRTAMDIGRLGAWLDATLDGPSSAISVLPLQGGASNLIFRVERGEDVYCLRRPPLVSNDPSANNMRRELRLLAALGRTDIPHARLVAGCDDVEVIGAPFALMQWIDGVAGKDPLPGKLGSDLAVRRDMAFALIDTLALISNADWEAIGLQGFGKPGNFLERQVDRWLGQLEKCRIRDLPYLDELAAWLRASTPLTQRTALIHGDYQFINVMFAPEPPARIAAVVDWESATIGDPMLDIGWVLALWSEPGEEPVHTPYFDYLGLPTRAEMAARYADKSGLDVGALPFYMALALFKLGVIMEGWYVKFTQGQTSHRAHAESEHDVPRMLARAARFAGIML